MLMVMLSLLLSVTTSIRTVGMRISSSPVRLSPVANGITPRKLPAKLDYAPTKNVFISEIYNVDESVARKSPPSRVVKCQM